MKDLIHRIHTNARMSKIARHANVVYLCGQTASGTRIEDVAGQTREVLSRIDALLVEAGSNRGCLLAVTIHLKDMKDFAAMNTEWEVWVPVGAAPARTTVQARLASPELLVEMTVVAAMG